MKKALSKEQVLEMAAKKSFIVNRYSYSHEKLRKMCRRMAKDGLLKLICQDSNGFVYRTA